MITSSSVRYTMPDAPRLDKESLFNESRVKLHWARGHIQELSSTWVEVVQKHANLIARQKLKPVQNFDPLQVTLSAAIPLHIGDCLRNLRSALDYLTSHLARHKGLSDERVMFPFNKERSGIEASFSEPKRGDAHRRGKNAGPLYDLSVAYPDLKTIILDKIQPHSADDGASASGDLLWRVITSDNIDKHRLMLPSVTSAGIRNMTYGGGTFIGFSVIGGRMPVRFPNAKIQGDPNISFDIEFAQPAKMAGRPVVSTLVEASDIVSEVIETFESHFKRSNKP